jgi:hypothetical protein
MEFELISHNKAQEKGGRKDAEYNTKQERKGKSKSEATQWGEVYTQLTIW